MSVLAFGPHPDDVEIFCGGTLIRMADFGHETGVVDLTRGELASRGTPELRAKEAEASGAVLGLKYRENLGLPDGFVSADSREQLNKVVEVLRRRKPELVLVPWIEDRHPDHAAAGALITKAVFFAGLLRFETDPPSERFVPRQVLYYQLRHRFVPSFVADTSAAFERKKQAIACYESQVSSAPNAPPTLIGSPRALEAIEARDRWFGSMIGTSHGEPLKTPNVPGLNDVVAHFRANPFFEAHAFEALK